MRLFNKKTGFWGRSLLWAVLLYLGCTLALDWQEVTSIFHKQEPVLVQVSTPNDFSGKAEIVVNTKEKASTFIKLLRTIANGISDL